MAKTDLLKKVLYTGVGVVSQTTERVKQSFGEVNKVSEEAEMKGKEQLEQLTEGVGSRREELGKQFKKIVDTVLGQLDIPNRTEAENLNAKIAELEEKVAAAKRKATRETTTRRKPLAKSTPPANEEATKEILKK